MPKDQSCWGAVLWMLLLQGVILGLLCCVSRRGKHPDGVRKRQNNELTSKTSSTSKTSCMIKSDVFGSRHNCERMTSDSTKSTKPIVSLSSRGSASSATDNFARKNVKRIWHAKAGPHEYRDTFDHKSAQTNLLNLGRMCTKPVVLAKLHPFVQIPSECRRSDDFPTGATL